MRISWDDYLALRQARLTAVGTRVHTIPGWTCATISGLEQVRPPAAALTAALGPTEALPRRSTHANAARHDAWLFDQKLRPTITPSDDSHTRWATTRLLALGERLPAEARGAWTLGWREDPTQDAQAAAVLAGLLTGSWTVRGPAEALLLGPVLKSFRGVCLARHLPPEVRRRATEDLREAFFYRLSLPDERGSPGWGELAARTLETGGSAVALLRVLGAAQRRRAAACAATRGRWADTARALFGGRTRLLRAQELLHRLHDVESLLDHHLQHRLRARWRAGQTDPDGDWRQIVQSRARARARLRALAAERPGALVDAVLALPALAARLRDAAARWAWAWAWEELARDFAFDLQRPVLAPCEQPDLLPAGWPEALERPLQTWLLLVILRDRLGHLERWAQTGSTGDRDSTWGRLLAESLPATLRSAGHSALRLELQHSLPRRLQTLRPTLQTLTELRPGRGLKKAFTSALQEGWCAELPLPRSGFPRMQGAAARALQALGQQEAP